MWWFRGQRQRDIGSSYQSKEDVEAPPATTSNRRQTSSAKFRSINPLRGLMETQDNSSLSWWGCLQASFEDVMDALTPDTNPIDPLDIERHKWLQYSITIMFYIAIILLFVYFFVTTYIEERDNVFLSPLRANVPSNCKTNPFLITGTFVVDKQGYWEGDVHYDSGQRFYQLQMKGVSMDDEEYSAMMAYFEQEVQKVHARLQGTDRTEALVAWSSFNAHYTTKSNQGSVHFYTVADASYIMDSTVISYQFISRNTMCVPQSSLKYDLSSSSYELTFENSYTFTPSTEQGLVLDPNVLVLDEPCPGIFNLTEDFAAEKSATSTLRVDVRSVMTALSINYKYQRAADLVNLITSKFFAGFQFARDDFYTGMNPVFCFDEEVCGVVLGGSIAIPFLFNSGFEVQSDSTCFMDWMERCPSDGEPCRMTDDMPATLSLLFISKDKMKHIKGDAELTAMLAVRDLAKSLIAPETVSSSLDKMFRLSFYTFVLELFQKNQQGNLTFQDLLGYPLGSCAANVGLPPDTDVSVGEIADLLLRDICGEVPCSILSMGIMHRIDYFQFFAGLSLNAYGNSWIGAIELLENSVSTHTKQTANDLSATKKRSLGDLPIMPAMKSRSNKAEQLSTKIVKQFLQQQQPAQVELNIQQSSLLSAILQEASNETAPGTDDEGVIFQQYGQVEEFYQSQIFQKIKTKPPVKLLESVMNCRKSSKQLVIDTLGIAHSTTELLLSIFMVVFIVITAYGLNFAANKYGFRGVYSSDDNQKEFRYLVAQTITKLANRDDEDMDELIDHLGSLCHYEESVLKRKPKTTESSHKNKSTKIHPVDSSAIAENPSDL